MKTALQLLRSAAHQQGSRAIRHPHGNTTIFRSNWQGVLTKFYDKASGTYKYRDWDEVMMQCPEPLNGKGQNLLDRHLDNERHIKRTEVRRRNIARVQYERKVKQVDDLTRYIKFVRDHPDDFNDRNDNDREED